MKMSKDTFYFSHDYNARHDPKIKKLIIKHSFAGLGMYWYIIEMLYEQNGYLLISDCEGIAYDMRTKCDRIMSVINDFGLFKKDDEKFWSESVLRRLDLRKEKSEKASKSARYRWNNANAQQSQSGGNAIKENKINNKPKTAAPNGQLSDRKNNLNPHF